MQIDQHLINKGKRGIALILSYPFILLGRLLQIIVNNATAQRKTFYELERLAYKESAKYIFDNMAHCVMFTKLEDFWADSINSAPEKGLVMEFGVFKGNSLNFFARQLSAKNDTRTVFGFDSFEGLSEDWVGYSLRQNKFDQGGRMPEVENNVQLVKGWVDETFTDFLEQNLANFDNRIAFMHLDMDTYTPTKYVLETALPYLQEGTVIAFDELLGYTGWRENEFRALMETVDQHFEFKYISYSEHRKLGYVSMYTRAALKITAVKSGSPYRLA